MNSKHQWVLAASIAAVLIFVVSQFLGQSKTAKQAESPATQGLSDFSLENLDDLDTEFGIADEEALMGPESADKTSYWVKGNRSQATGPNETVVIDTDWSNKFQAREAVESALAGNVNDAIEIGDIFSRCLHGFDSKAQLKTRLDKLSSNILKTGRIPNVYLAGTGENLGFESFDDYQEYMWIQFSECTVAESVFESLAGDRLVELAEAGNVAARFLYAMRLPAWSAVRTDILLDWLIYQKRAEEFTWLNINEGEPLGLLAFGRSLEGRQAYYFTPRNTIYGLAFIWAAQKCGLENVMVDTKIGNMTSGVNRGIAHVGGPMEKLAEEIVETFCN